MTGSTLTIGLVLPDVLGTYGDDGNALVLRQRARARGIAAEILPIRLGDAVPSTCDLYTMGGGEDTAQILAAEHLLADGGLPRAVAAGRPLLAICAGLQICGVSFHADGRTIDGLSLIDATTATLASRMIGEIQATPAVSALSQPLTGFANHMGATLLGADAAPLGHVTHGTGNCDAHAAAGRADQVRAEGAVQGSVVATYMHGPVLARNPELADYLLTRAIGSLPPLQGAEQLEGEIAQLRRERLQR